VGEQEEDRLFEEALDLVIRLQNDPDNPVALDLARNWCARGPQYRTAWEEAAEIHGLAGKVITRRRNRERRARTAVTRRAAMLGGGAALIAGALYAPGVLLRARADFTTRTAEIRAEALPDGSRATLGPDSAIAVHFGPDERRVELIAGMAFFDVAPETARPFRASAGDLTVTAVGTAFDLSLDAGWRSVSVDRGAVGLSAGGTALRPGEQLAAGNWLTLDAEGVNAERGAREADQIAAWRAARIVAERESVAAVVARIARWQPGRVVIADPSLAERRISGVFDLSQPLAALEAVVLPHGGRIRSLPPWLTVISTI